MVHVIWALLGSVIGFAGVLLWVRLTPKFKPGTTVMFKYGRYDEVNTGIYVRHYAPGYHQVIPTSPAWWGAVHDKRAVPVHHKQFVVTPSDL